MGMAEKIFVKKVDRTAGKLELNADQMAKLDQLKLDLRKNFEEGRHEKKEAMAKIREEGVKENPDIPKMTAVLQESLRAETERINKAFDLLLDYQKNLNDAQKRKLGQMLSERIRNGNSSSGMILHFSIFSLVALTATWANRSPRLRTAVIMK